MERFFWKGQELPATMFLYKCHKQGLPDLWYEDVFELMYIDSSLNNPLFMHSPLKFGKGLTLIDCGGCYRVE